MLRIDGLGWELGVVRCGGADETLDQADCPAHDFRWSRAMRMLVFVCGALLALAIAFLLLSSGPYPDVVLEMFRSPPRPQQIAGIVVAVLALIVLGSAFWSNEQLRRQRGAAELLESRLRLEEAQRDVDLATH